MDLERQYTFETFEQYAESIRISQSHPHWDAFKAVWKVARSEVPKVIINVEKSISDTDNES